MGVLQKTSAILLGVVFCLFCSNSALALEERFCRCVVTMENETHCPATTVSQNIEFDFSENRNLGSIIREYGLEPDACRVSSFPLPDSNVATRFNGVNFPGNKVCLSPLGMADSNILRLIGFPPQTADHGRWPLFNIWNLETMLNQKITSEEACDESQFDFNQSFNVQDIICYNTSRLNTTKDLFEVIGAVGTLDGSNVWHLSVSCGSSSNPLGSGATSTPPVEYGPGYEPIAWSFPTDKINSLNKIGIAGTGTTQVQVLIGRLIKYAVGFLGALALCLVIYSGLRFMLSQGDEGKQGEALKMMLWSGIGIVALLGSYSMVTFVLSILR